MLVYEQSAEEQPSVGVLALNIGPAQFRGSRDNLLASLVENEIVSGSSCAELLQAALRELNVGGRFHPEQTAVAVTYQDIERNCWHSVLPF